jgi:hypothetical protein
MENLKIIKNIKVGSNSVEIAFTAEKVEVAGVELDVQYLTELTEYEYCDMIIMNLDRIIINDELRSLYDFCWKQIDKIQTQLY